MGFKKFSLLIALRTVLIMATLFILVLLYVTPGYHAATLLVFGLMVFQGLDIFRFVSRTNSELTRFLDAARYADFSQRFELSGLGAGFGDLGHAFTDILKRFHTVRASQEEELKRLKAMVEHIPVPLIGVKTDGKLILWNNASRRLFGSNHVTKIGDLAPFGEDFSAQVETIRAGDRRLVRFSIDGMDYKLSLAATEITMAGDRERLISLQDIGGELDSAQLEAWQDLVRVLTHEIMNSITPVASLAKTAADLVEDAKAKITDHPDAVEELTDVGDAVRTVARRSDGLMQFVGNYRRLTRLPKPKKTKIALSAFFDSIARVAAQDWDALGIELRISTEPGQLDLLADADMLEQILINLLKNAEQSLADAQQKCVWLQGRLNKRGRVVIEVSDSGAGVPDDIAAKIFVPYFTTKRDGSGVGLALSRQIMIAHGGNIKLEGHTKDSAAVADTDAESGAKFALVF